MQGAPPDIVSKLPGVETTIFTVMSELAREQGALNLSQGFPDFDGPPLLLERVQHYLTHGHNQYAPMMGVPALREALAGKVLDLYGLGVDPDLGPLYVCSSGKDGAEQIRCTDVHDRILRILRADGRA